MPSWNWDEEATESGVVHQNTANTDHTNATVLKQGYDYANFSEITPTPIAAWPLHEDGGSTANDLAGTNDGIYRGPILGQNGLLGTTAPEHDAIDDWVEMNNDPYGIADGTASSFTLTAWVYWDGSNASSGVSPLAGPYDVNNPPGNPAYSIFIDDENLRAQIQNTANNFVGSPPGTTVPQNQWSFLAATYDGSTLKAWLNASGAGSTNTSDSIFDAESSAPIGPHVGVWKTDGADDWFGGRIADARIYNTALTQSELQSMYDVVATTGEWVGNGKLL